MKTISATVFAALFAATSARFLDTTSPLTTPFTNYGSPNYASSLKCGQCIGAGNTYCIQRNEGNVNNGAVTAETCIAVNAQGGQSWTDISYSCSNMYSDRVFAKNTCNFNTAQCGPSNSVSFTSTNNQTQDARNVTITALPVGQTCFYTVKTQCGAIAFTPEPTTLSRFEFEYVSYQDANVNTTEPVVSTLNVANVHSNTTSKRQSASAQGLPRRDHFFNGELGGNQVQNQNQTTYTNTTFHGPIYGRSGRYDKLVGGRKVYGNPTQGALQLGNLTNLTTADCAARTLHLAVTSLQDNSNTNVTFSTVPFYRPPVVPADTGASFISMTFAAVLGLVSLAFF